MELERETGIEPATSSLGSWHSTTELLPPLMASNFRNCNTLRRSEQKCILYASPEIISWPRDGPQ